MPSPRGWQPVLFHLPLAASRPASRDGCPACSRRPAHESEDPAATRRGPGALTAPRASAMGSLSLSLILKTHTGLRCAALLCAESVASGSSCPPSGLLPAHERSSPSASPLAGTPASRPGLGLVGENDLARPTLLSGAPRRPRGPWARGGGPGVLLIYRCKRGAPARDPTAGAPVWGRGVRPHGQPQENHHGVVTAVAPPPVAGNGLRSQRPSPEGPASAPEQAEGRARGAGTPTQARVAKRWGPEAPG